MRVNARLDDARARKLDELCRRTGRSRTDVLRAAIDRYYAQEAVEPPCPADILRRNAFIGCGEADTELSRDYKQHLTESLAKKTDDHR
ncbi:ribbon-helix-helix domain-containing protein [Thiocapsa bogorovii]|uniref:ribbon-helix-helix domain-containing protein n=1 Tax=Thiocapsa bogorovii TaxID=521689 RepID=UPI001E2E96D0|nr:ribbon-helix-helix domain-containing protein [Thiocapsa bogorovii]UHD15506.1 ribbon-helix-helix domain-containing protein [Thiocapsa bogorovii]